MGDREIASTLGLSAETVKRVNFNIREKIGQDNRVGMVVWAIKNGVVIL